MTNPIDQAIAANEELVALKRKEADLLEELGKSLRIMKVWPEAFKHDAKCTINTSRQRIERSDGLSHQITKAEYDFIKGVKAKK